MTASRRGASGDRRIRVLLVDDQAMVRGGFRMILWAEDDIDVVGEAADGAEAIEAVPRLRPDIVLMDIQMPGMDGLEATRRIVAGGPPARVVILTTFDGDDTCSRRSAPGPAGSC